MEGKGARGGKESKRREGEGKGETNEFVSMKRISRKEMNKDNI